MELVPWLARAQCHEGLAPANMPSCLAALAMTTEAPASAADLGKEWHSSFADGCCIGLYPSKGEHDSSWTPLQNSRQ